MSIDRVSTVPTIPPRSREGHKGDYGKVLVTGGSRGMIGAVALAANAALRGGAGLVTFAAPETVQLAIAPLCPCATSVPLSCEANGGLSGSAIREMHDALRKCDVLALGPGLSVGGRPQELVRSALEQDKPVVLDADGLNNLARIDGWWDLRRCPLLLTPHPGEFSRLTGQSIPHIQGDRETHALHAVRQWTHQGDPRPPLVLVLKGAGTIVTDGARLYVNDTGNPGMATGGAGDILTGLSAALLGQGFEPFDAAVLAVHAHGRAADLGVEDLGETSLIATDLLAYLPAALRERVDSGENGHAW